MFGSALIALTTLTAVVSAATAATNFTTCCTVDPMSASLSDRNSWCRAQVNTCPLLCQNGQFSDNSCNADNLTYKCTCLTGPGPGNLSNYDQTLATFECRAWRDQCTAAHPNDQNGQQYCQSFECGKQNASLVYLAASSSSAAAAAMTASTGSPGSTGAVAGATNSVSGFSASRSGAEAAATAAVQFGKLYGTAALGVVGMAVFGFALL